MRFGRAISVPWYGPLLGAKDVIDRHTLEACGVVRCGDRSKQAPEQEAKAMADRRSLGRAW